ncbi:MAG TPA: hypothetical protein DIV44_09035 [Leeuwenhoekiella sp.]|uniref:hypothetical protein n=1 Tax=Leeuwenhoekiella palythoae TaxID=573501 RepID=UPI000C47657C|nr:hypothetical protein [Leeuwenhoekiella palythoae]MBH11643.1 hypothetical protein [Leeuwenhoekiella sp.]UBZ10336.1 hypothetical protein LDL79_16245 [Leeuwenhoekiella palythoae]HAX16035.1 hypothetical protein [Leeuwenhoekiella sp.]HCQ76937.1 hypothetical protein [Leeuwenhoekiella sp.]|tara:strand:- start:479 stop:1072 length:594 start_codon:yes stop_codon:yes gene_type:complete
MLHLVLTQTNNDYVSIPLVYIEVIVLMLGAFSIGYFFAYYYQKSKYVKRISNLRQKLSEQAGVDIEDPNLEETLPDKDIQIAAKAKKKRLAQAELDKTRTELDFERIGYASYEDADDLQKIIGIGPYTEEKLNTIGIYTFDQISKFNTRDIEIVTERIQFFPDRIVNDNWVAKAKLLQETKQQIKLRRDRNVRMKKA